jgi:hypothetical protein
MGNWRTVRIVGTCPVDDVEPLKQAIDDEWNDATWGPLTATRGLAGLGSWPAEKMDCVGNLAERDYDPEEVAAHLKRLVSHAPGLALKIHCGDEYEEKNCIATITVADGQVTEGPPEVETVSEISDDQLMANFAAAVQRGPFA